MFVEKQICVFAIQLAAETPAVVVVVPVVALYAGSVVAVHQRTEVVDNAYQLILLPCEFLVLFKCNGSCYFLAVYDVPVSTVATMIEPFQVHNQVLGQRVQRHCLISQFVALAD